MLALAEHTVNVIKSFNSQSQDISVKRTKVTSGLPIGQNDDPLVIIGASYAKDWQIDRYRGIRIINKGVSGDTTVQMLDRFQRDVLDEDPSAVIIWGFINNIFRSPRENIDDTINKSKDHLKKMATLAVDAGTYPIMATEVTIRPPTGIKEFLLGTIGKWRGKQSYQDYVNEHVRSVNQWIRDYTREEGYVLLDLESVLTDGSGMRAKEYATSDGSHISEIGYDRLNAYILKQIDPLIAK